MALYDIIYQWFAENIWSSTNIPECTWEIGGQSIEMSSWLNHTSTIVVLVVLAIALFSLAFWLFRWVAGLVVRVGR